MIGRHAEGEGFAQHGAQPRGVAAGRRLAGRVAHACADIVHDGHVGITTV